MPTRKKNSAGHRQETPPGGRFLENQQLSDEGTGAVNPARAEKTTAHHRRGLA
jgi:hypothetical protein